MFVFETLPMFNKSSYNAAYHKTKRKGKPEWKAAKASSRKSITDSKYLSRKIVAIDGEGINVRRGLRKGDHLYILLAINDTMPLIDKAGLKSEDILWYLWENLNSKDINVIYGGSYDFNLWVRDLIADDVARLYHSNYTTEPVEFRGFELRWIKGKAFEIARGEKGSKERKVVTINDVISFFQQPFIQACDSYLGEYEGRDILVREKARRGNFTVEEIANIASYNTLELDLLVRLVSELRLRLNRVSLRPRRWNSPGAIASALFQRESVSDHRNEKIPAAVAQAGRYAYAGGRFEMLKYGAVKGKVYEYDINSAYPRALLEVPSLAKGEWKHYVGISPEVFRTLPAFTVYRVRFTGSNASVPTPVFHRGSNGTISYPLRSENWVWSPEYRTLEEYCSVVEGASYETLEAWAWFPETDYHPFEFIGALYLQRQELKAKGDGAHVGIKLALNSIYGKLAQQVGWVPAKITKSGKKLPVRVPTYHQLEWAGYVTSWCRANVLRAALSGGMETLNSVIAFETDALFTAAPLDIKIGTGLGEWEETVFDSLTYVQSGHYYGTKDDGKPVVKCRGIDKGFISRQSVETALALPESQRVLNASLTRFYGAGIALARGLDKYWCKWLEEPKILQLRPTGKRIHGVCDCASVSGPLELNRWHTTFCPTAGGMSSEYPVEWVNPNPEMTELTEFRESENFFAD